MNNVVNYLLPYMTETDNASSDPSRRAFSGLSLGGATAGYAMFNNTDDFGYFCLFSGPITPDAAPDYTLPALKEKGIFIGFGWYDFVCFRSLYSVFPDADGNKVSVTRAFGQPEGSTFEYEQGLFNAGVPFTNLQIAAGHQWSLWRKLASYALENVLWK
jgi:enterochelin esterase-like enzyme